MLNGLIIDFLSSRILGWRRGGRLGMSCFFGSIGGGWLRGSCGIFA